MASASCESYLVTEVMTSTPQKLQLMLIEGAMRSIERARRCWRSGDNDQACESIICAQKIVGQMLGALDRDVAPELVNKVAAVYVFIFRGLVDVNLSRDEKKLDDVQRVLEIERGTWRQVCEKLGSRQEPGGNSYTPQTPAAAPALPNLADFTSGMTADLPAGGFSLEA
jgi:flagellar secretion chaperone FliS